MLGEWIRWYGESGREGVTYCSTVKANMLALNLSMKPVAQTSSGAHCPETLGPSSWFLFKISGSASMVVSRLPTSSAYCWGL